MSLSIKQASMGLGLAFALAACAPASAMTDSEFLQHAAQGDNSEVALGKLALSKAGSAQVKSFAQMLVEDHTKGKTQVAALAQKMGMKASDDMAPEAKQEMSKLEPLSGAQFDKAFTAYMVKDHEKDVSDFKTEASSGKGEVAKLAAETVPVLQKHLDMAKSLDGKV